MRKYVISLVALLALAIALPATAAETRIQITKAGFVPASVTVKVGDTVTWTNADTAPHQVVADKGEFTSPVLSGGQSFSYTFTSAGSVKYHDGTDRTSKGTITVQAAAPGPGSVTISVSRPALVFGQTVTLSGTVSDQKAGEKVSVMAQPCGESSATSIASVTSTTGGSWSYTATPTKTTAYSAKWKSATSQATTVKLRPKLVLTRVGLRFRIQALPNAFSGKFVNVQRRTSLGGYVLVKRVVLNSASTATFSARLHRGRVRLRAVMPSSQAAPCFITGTSNTLSFLR